jgi:hypothetical protein
MPHKTQRCLILYMPNDDAQRYSILLPLTIAYIHAADERSFAITIISLSLTLTHSSLPQMNREETLQQTVSDNEAASEDIEFLDLDDPEDRRLATTNKVDRRTAMSADEADTARSELQAMVDSLSEAWKFNDQERQSLDEDLDEMVWSGLSESPRAVIPELKELIRRLVTDLVSSRPKTDHSVAGYDWLAKKEQESIPDYKSSVRTGGIPVSGA